MLPDSKITEIFFVIDEFSQVFDATIKEKSIFDGINLITTVRKNMKEGYMIQNERIILRKRAIIETISGYI